ncbi:hypothetical protein I2I05_04675 [Hymenobacter sp. BT683]|uniref:Lipocalin-like domain-containing protein n=1 Tax=Hymenobacter jeongseonensis TaxID=2791027 RepID=A0ABS0IET5_9BACT|nr:hypothetical protein [Hymenobacter jeongseonensis]MBF9236682.1 hypothetical protein [Hymenobacter jeongseonensis]
MHSLSRSFRLIALATLSLLAGCKEDAELGTGLAGTWKLTNRQCFCPPSALPSEMVTFSDTEFYFYKENRQTGYGTYAFESGKTCGGSVLIPVLRFDFVSDNRQLTHAEATVTGNTLVLDYGSPCDAPRDTYQRVR